MAQEIGKITSDYLFKNLEESCLTLAATEYQAGFQIALSALHNGPKIGAPCQPVDPNCPNNQQAQSEIQALVDLDSRTHIWKYCDTIFNKFKEQTLEAEQTTKPSPTPTPTCTPTPAAKARTRKPGQTAAAGRPSFKS
ncbi:MAG TPA: hypothetical protein VMA09_00890 [Candidatus Binataceae bacterium]|nr:hypothetical protein [Candidatus Binataceae bacterium]